VLLVRKLKLHLGPILLTVGLLVLALAWQSYDSVQRGQIASGSSLPGLVIGSIAAAIIYFELLLWPRKAFRRFRLFQTKTWLAFHLWLGLASGPLAWIHSGYRFGGTFTTVLMALLFFVLASGIYGWIMQIVIPRWMLGHIPYETIHSQIDDVSVLGVLEARQLLTVALGPKPEGSGSLAELDPIASAMRGSSQTRNADGRVESIVVGARRRRVPPRRALEENEAASLDDGDSRQLWKAYASTIEPYLLRENAHVPSPRRTTTLGTSSALSTPQRSSDWFSMLRQTCSPSTEPIVNQLEDLVTQRQQFDSQRRAQAWLHGWIGFHAGVSVLLGILLIAHIVLALKYW
jgi:hypothetical protein